MDGDRLKFFYQNAEGEQKVQEIYDWHDTDDHFHGSSPSHGGVRTFRKDRVLHWLEDTDPGFEVVADPGLSTWRADPEAWAPAPLTRNAKKRRRTTRAAIAEKIGRDNAAAVAQAQALARTRDKTSARPGWYERGWLVVVLLLLLYPVGLYGLVRNATMGPAARWGLGIGFAALWVLFLSA